MTAHVVADASWGGDSGTGRYSREVLARMSAYYGDRITLHRRKAPASPLAPIAIALDLLPGRGSVFWSPQYMAPAFSAVPFVVTLHDLLQVRFGSAPKRLYFQFVLRRLYRSCAAVVTDSDFSRGEILEWIGIPDCRVVVGYAGVSGDFTPVGAKRDFGYPYLLYVGNRRAHKNLDRLVAAFASSAVPSDLHLVMSGAPTAALREMAVRLNVERRLHFAGVIQDLDLPALYRGATAVAYVSRYEGFGLPVLEAMACGIPVVASNTTSIPEVAGDGALLVDPTDVQEIAHAMSLAVVDNATRARLRSAGLARAKRFNWDTTAATVIELLDEL